MSTVRTTWHEPLDLDGSEVDVHPVPDDVTTTIAFGGADGRRAVLSRSRSGRLAETTWPRPASCLDVEGRS